MEHLDCLIPEHVNLVRRPSLSLLPTEPEPLPCLAREALSRAGAQSPAWRQQISELATRQRLAVWLLELARVGLARRLASHPQQQVEVASRLDLCLREQRSQLSLLQQAVCLARPQVHRPVGTTLLYASLSMLGLLLVKRPGLCLLLVHLYNRAGQCFLEALDRAALCQGAFPLSTLLGALRRQQARQSLILAPLQRLVPMGSRLESAVARGLVTLWYADTLSALEGPESQAGQAARTLIHFDTPWYRQQLELLRNLSLDTFHPSRRSALTALADVGDILV